MKVKFEKKDLCLVAVPSYGGRDPSVVTDMFRKTKRVWVQVSCVVELCKVLMIPN